jgi:hypothetical protein
LLDNQRRAAQKFNRLPILDFIILDQNCLDIRRALVVGAAELGDAPRLVSGEEPGEDDEMPSNYSD